MHRLRILGIFAALALLIAACGDPTPPAGTHALTVEVVGDGTVTFDASGDSAVGTNNVAAGEVTIVATPNAGSTFVGWTGDACAGEGATCTFTLDADATITATFQEEGDDTHQLTVAVAGDGTGTVEFDAGGGDDAVGTHDIADGEEVTLVATATTGDFAGWTGDVCAGEGTTCTFTMDADIAVTANFNVPGGDTFDLTVATDGDGEGTVTFGPGGDDAVGTNTFDEGEVVVLFAAATTGSFVGWTGEACDGQGVTCSFVITANTSVTATFSDADPTPGSVAVSDGADDGFEWVDASNSGVATHIPPNPYNNLEYSGMGYLKRYEAEVINGFIFRDLGIPAGSIITSAYIQFTAIDRGDPGDPLYEPSVGDPTLVITAEANVNPDPIGHLISGTNLSSRTTVPGEVSWEDIPEWERGDATEAQRSADLTALLQELVELEGWDETGDAMFMIANGDEVASDGFRQILTSEDGGAPVLHFEYTPPAP